MVFLLLCKIAAINMMMRLFFSVFLFDERGRNIFAKNMATKKILDSCVYWTANMQGVKPI